MKFGSLVSILFLTGLQLGLRAEVQHPTCGVIAPQSSAARLHRQASWTIGQKKLLYLHVRFAGDANDPTTAAVAQSDLAEANENFKAISYNLFSLDWTITPVLPLAGSADYYVDRREQLLQDARDAALRAGYNYEEYDLEIVRHNVVPSWAGGYGNLGRRGTWIQVAGAYIIVHEIGHNLGLNHANFLDTSAPSTGPKVSPPFPTNTNEGREGHPFDPDSLLGHETINGFGQSVEYGDGTDVMGGGDTPPQFNALYKAQLGWLSSTQQKVVNDSGIYRLSAFDLDAPETENICLLQLAREGIVQGSFNTYWIQHKAGPSIFPGVPDGIQIHVRPPNSDSSSLLLDMTPGTEHRQVDATLPVGKTFSDRAAGIHITPLARTEPAGQIEVAVRYGYFPENHAPALQLSSSALVVAPSEIVSLTATASDQDNDELAYFWDLKNGAPSPNTNQVAVSWKNPGDYVVRCEVSDLRGGLAARHIVVRVGEVNTFRINGTIKDENGRPVVGARVHNGILFRNPGEGNHVFDFTDSDGGYILANLKPGSYTNGAFLHGYRIERPTTDPVYITESNVEEANLRATHLPVVTVQASSPTIEEGAADSNFIFTRSGPFEQPLTISFSLTGSALARSDYADYFLPRLTFAAGASTALLPLSTFADNETEGEETVTLTIHYPTQSTREIIEGGRTNLVTFYYPGWELRPGPGTNFWTQTDPFFVPGPPATFTIKDSGLPPSYRVSVDPGGLVAIEDPLVESEFIISREGGTIDPLLIFFQLSGTAVPGEDYQTFPKSLIIPAGEEILRVPLVPIADGLVEGEEMVTLTILPDSAYEIIAGEATVPLRDNAAADLKFAVSLLADGRIKLILNGKVGQRHVLENSTDLKNWTPFRTNQIFMNPLELVLPNDSSEKFFRAHTQP